MRHQIPAEIDRLATQIVDAGFQVHDMMGPGLLEKAYEECLVHEFKQRSIWFEQQREIPLSYKGLVLTTHYRADLIVASCIVVEVKAVDALLPLHQAQLITYLKLTNCRLGFLLNFNVRLFKNGVRRIAL
mgnify:CR=1 FL=1